MYRRGISPIIAVLLLILIAISAGVMVYAFISGWVGTATRNTSPPGTSLINVEYAYADSSNDLLTLAIRNIGSTPVSLDKVYIKSLSSTVVYPGGMLQRIISIRENSGNDLNGYQVKIVLDSSNFDFSKANSDGSDVRFYDLNGNEIPYYIELWDSVAQRAVIWVKVDLHASSSTRIKMVYHNPSLTTSASDPYRVFDFYDGFDGSSLDSSVWSASTGATYSVGGGELFIQTGSIYTVSPLFTTPKGKAYEAKVMYDTIAESYSGLMIADSHGTWGGNSAGNALSYLMTQDGGVDKLTIWGADGVGPGYDISDDLLTYSTGVYYIIGFSYDPSSGVDYYVLDAQHNLLNNIYWGGTWSNDVYMFLGFFMGSNSNSINCDDIHIDWVRVRKYVSPEPTVSIGAEEPYTIGSINSGGLLILKIYMAIDPGVKYQVIIVTKDGGKTIVNLVGG